MLAAYYATFNRGGGPLPNGFSLFEGITDPSIEPLGCISMTLNEALVQSVSAEPGGPEVIRVFPAWPQAWDACFCLLVRGGSLFSSSMRAGRIEFVEIESRSGEDCRMRNPWEGQPCQVQQTDCPVTRLSGEILHFETKPGERFLIWPEGESVPSSRQITAEPSTGPVSYSFALPGGTACGVLGKD